VSTPTLDPDPAPPHVTLRHPTSQPRVCSCTVLHTVLLHGTGR
jgi:hypothetical protein